MSSSTTTSESPLNPITKHGKPLRPRAPSTASSIYFLKSSSTTSRPSPPLPKNSAAFLSAPSGIINNATGEQITIADLLAFIQYSEDLMESNKETMDPTTQSNARKEIKHLRRLVTNASLRMGDGDKSVPAPKVLMPSMRKKRTAGALGPISTTTGRRMPVGVPSPLSARARRQSRLPKSKLGASVTSAVSTPQALSTPTISTTCTVPTRLFDSAEGSNPIEAILGEWLKEYYETEEASKKDCFEEEKEEDANEWEDLEPMIDDVLVPPTKNIRINTMIRTPTLDKLCLIQTPTTPVLRQRSSPRTPTPVDVEGRLRRQKSKRSVASRKQAMQARRRCVMIHSPVSGVVRAPTVVRVKPVVEEFKDLVQMKEPETTREELDHEEFSSGSSLSSGVPSLSRLSYNSDRDLPPLPNNEQPYQKPPPPPYTEDLLMAPFPDIHSTSPTTATNPPAARSRRAIHSLQTALATALPPGFNPSARRGSDSVLLSTSRSSSLPKKNPLSKARSNPDLSAIDEELPASPSRDGTFVKLPVYLPHPAQDAFLAGAHTTCERSGKVGWVPPSGARYVGDVSLSAGVGSSHHSQNTLGRRRGLSLEEQRRREVLVSEFFGVHNISEETQIQLVSQASSSSSSSSLGAVQPTPTSTTTTKAFSFPPPPTHAPPSTLSRVDRASKFESVLLEQTEETIKVTLTPGWIRTNLNNYKPHSTPEEEHKECQMRMKKVKTKWWELGGEPDLKALGVIV
ncbi:hypothetical protein HDV05_002260 [Chytridiales sp. JEL 0842]|nr:hypothetical protein HDV05_002260 [Chytridiales sp. JEL 0842]